MNKDFKNDFTPQCYNYYNTIREYAERNNLKNTLIALDLACELHHGAYRDGGLPYIVHPLELTYYLIILHIKDAISEKNLSELHNSDLAYEITLYELDVLLSSSLLHDVLEECKNKLPSHSIDDLVDIYDLDPNVALFVSVLTKEKSIPEYSDYMYFSKIAEYWQTLIIKLVDRVCNCSTITDYIQPRMIKYVNETRKYFYDLCSTGKMHFPHFSGILTILKYLLVSICETVSSSLSLNDIIVPVSPEKTFYFLKGFALKGHMKNTLIALPLAKSYYKDYKRKTGDPFIIHPLRVASYLISLNIDDDDVCAAAILHEIINTCHLDYNGVEIVTKHHINPHVLELIRLAANAENYPLDIYYDALRKSPEALMLKLSDCAHTCTKLMDFSDEEIKEYIEECEKYIYTSCIYGVEHYPKYVSSIGIALFHISSICRLVKSLRLK